jgi:hypothetical protein
MTKDNPHRRTPAIHIYPFRIFFAMMRKWGMGCMWRDRMMGGPGFRESLHQSRGEPPESALEILNKRYAGGEIDKEEYEDKKTAISSMHENTGD